MPNAIFIGLLPDLPREKFVFVGNSSLVGARQILLSHEAIMDADEIARKITYFELSVEPGYMDEYMAALFFPHTDLTKFPASMSLIIAIAGKGAQARQLYLRLLSANWPKEIKEPSWLLMPTQTLTWREALGLKIKEDIGGIVDSVAKKPDIVPVGMSKDRYIDYRIQTSIVEENGFDL